MDPSFTNKRDVPKDVFELIDRLYQSYLAQSTAGISPAAIRTAYASWGLQLAQSPGRLMELATYVPMHIGQHLNKMVTESQPASGKDVRFLSESWQWMPWRCFAENFLLAEDWWKKATNNISGLSKHSERVISFISRQWLDALSPTNFVLTNPDLFQETIRSGGQNLARGSYLGWKDCLEKLSNSPIPGVENFIPGKQVAITPGKVVFQNHLIEVIQYAAQTEHVYKEPILIIPAWIMKYYILDLSPHNSMVRWLVSQGHTVFIISWRNPTAEDRHLSMDDYFREGAMAALDVVSKIIPRTKIHLMGYCLGGTLAMITSAAMARMNDKRLRSLTLLAAQGDFTEAGELMLFIDQSELSFLKNMMWRQGYLDTKQMSGSFQMLRSYDLIWSKMIKDYLHGGERSMIDLLAWNADSTRMPYKMHSEYLEKLFLNNDFAAGRFVVEDHHVAAENIRVPSFVVSTEKDHVAPWHSVYKLHLMVGGDLTFVLASGGHNAGIISEPGHIDRSYFIRERKRNSAFLGPHHWLKAATKCDGSWWTAWHEWLIAKSSQKQILAPALDPTLPDAPGSYIFQK